MVKNNMKEGKTYCTKCNVKMKRVVLSKYKYVGRKSLYNIPAYKCSRCNQIFFTEQQAKEMEERTKKKA